ncbi:MAG: hypothetical protein NC253_04165 [Ruminococcus sp.]|nr:hypothetical protein [Ruminococcus sp.]MCM1381454.1 hypothetical protein [Muribaculaceae bacterium]MCM1479676.1 hypothetical protein [Muribaculaceae bacterium]
MLISELNFRSVYHKIFIICDPDLSYISDLFEYDESTNGIMVYGYIDYEAGLTYEILSCVKISDDNTIYVYGGNEGVTFKLRNGSVKNKKAFFIENTKMYEEMFAEKVKSVNEGYCCSAQINSTRKLQILDSSRNQDYPDDVMVILFKEDNQPEGCWVRCSGLADNSIKGILLNEPNQDFSVHLNSEIDFNVLKNDDGNFMCVAIIE